MFLWGLKNVLLVNCLKECLTSCKGVKNISYYAFFAILRKKRLSLLLHGMSQNLGIYLTALNNNHHEIALIIFPVSLHCRGAGYSKYINLNFSRLGLSVLTLMHLVTVDLMEASSVWIGHISLFTFLVVNISLHLKPC